MGDLIQGLALAAAISFASMMPGSRHVIAHANFDVSRDRFSPGGPGGLPCNTRRSPHGLGCLDDIQEGTRTWGTRLGLSGDE